MSGLFLCLFCPGFPIWIAKKYNKFNVNLDVIPILPGKKFHPAEFAADP